MVYVQRMKNTSSQNRTVYCELQGNTRAISKTYNNTPPQSKPFHLQTSSISFPISLNALCPIGTVIMSTAIDIMTSTCILSTLISIMTTLSTTVTCYGFLSVRCHCRVVFVDLFRFQVYIAESIRFSQYSKRSFTNPIVSSTALIASNAVTTESYFYGSDNSN